MKARAGDKTLLRSTRAGNKILEVIKLPNNITNRLTIIGSPEQISQVLDFIKIEKESDNKVFGPGTIDFNKITPCPKWVFSKNLGKKDEEKYGPENCWYKWNITNWGTKWNAYGQPDRRNNPNAIYFQTAWVCQQDLIKKLSWIFPDVEFEIAWADEDLGHNVGIVKFKDGIVIEEYIPDGGSLEAKRLFFEITQDTLEEHDMNENYEYIDEVQS